MDENQDDNPSKKEKIPTEKPTSIYKVPEPILTDILSLLPVKTILECYRVNRSFHSITTEDPRFYPLHFSRSPELLLCSPSLEKMVLVDLDYEGDRARELNLRLDNMEVMNSCRGMLCIRPRNSFERIYILNPFTLEFVVLPNLFLPMVPPKFIRVIEWVGLGYSPKTNEYKVLSVAEYRIPSTGKQFFVMDIFTLGGTGSWRRLKGHKPALQLTHGFSTFLNGSFHWIMNEYAIDRKYDSLTYFDLENETFGEISLPDIFDLSEDPDRGKRRVLSFGAFEDLLTVCLWLEDRTIAVWVMNEYGDPASWHVRIYLSLFTIIRHFVPEYIHCFIPLKFIDKSESNEPVIICLLDNVLVTLELESFMGPEVVYNSTNIVKTSKFSHKMPTLSKTFMHIPILMSFKKLIAGVTDVHFLRPTGRKVWRRRMDDGDGGGDGDGDDDEEDEWVISTIQEST